MITDWYFCCCVRSTPEQTEAFLNTLDVLNNSDKETEPQLVNLTLAELRRAEIWMQIYALPRILALLKHDEYRISFAPLVKDYLKELTSLVPDRLEAKYLELAQSMISPLGSEHMLEVLRQCSVQSQTLQGRPLSHVPYLDIAEFLPEELVLAATLSQSSRDADFASRLNEEFKNEGTASAIGTLFEKAISFQCGRFSFILASEVFSCLHSDELLEKARFSIWHSESDAPEYEPDLLTVSAKAHIADMSTGTESAQKAKLIGSLVEESLKFSLILSHLGPNFRSRTKPAGALRRMGIDPNDSSTDALPFVYWQVVLWEMALEIDPVEFGLQIGSYWCQPLQSPVLSNESYEISFPMAGMNRDAWLWVSRQLLGLRGTKFSKTRISVRHGSSLAAAPMVKWLLASPGHPLEGDPTVLELPRGQAIRKTQKKKEIDHSHARNRYPSVRNHTLLIRTLACASISVELLRRLGETTPSKEVFSVLVVHTSDILTSCYRKWLFKHNETGIWIFPHTLPLPITGLAKYIDDLLNLIGRGHLPAIPPEIFLALLQEGASPMAESITLVSPSANGSAFRNTIVPEVMIDWIAGGYTNATENSTAARWLPHIVNVYEQHRLGVHPPEEKILAALITRFLTSDYRCLQIEDFMPANHELPRDIIQVQRILLLCDIIPNTDFIKALKLPQKLVPTIRLVLQINQLSSIEHAFSGRDADSVGCTAQLRSLVAELTDLLNGLDRNTDRFIRLRLLELLGSPLLEKYPEVQELIALIILEIGSVYETDKMLQRIFRPDRGVSEEIAKHLQSLLLRSVYRDLELGSQQRQFGKSMQGPRLSLIAVQKKNVLTNLLTRVIYEANSSSTTDSHGELVDVLRKLGQQSSATHKEIEYRVVDRELEHVGGRRVTLRTSPNQDIHNWNLSGAIHNPNENSARFFIEDWNVGGLLNLFQESRDFVEAFLNRPSSKPIRVLAFVVRIQADADGMLSCTFNCGLDSYLQLSSETVSRFMPGELVALEIAKHPGQKWTIGGAENLERLEPLERVGETRTLKVREFWDAKGERRILQILGRASNVITKLCPVDYWDPDISRSFRQIEVPDRLVKAQLSDEGEWLPEDGDFLSLMMREFTGSAKSLTLTLIGSDILRSDRKRGWRFSAMPGRIYLLDPSDWMEEDLSALSEQVASYTDAAGLFVTVVPEMEGGRVKLHLLRSTGADCDHMEQDALTLPFDDRNIRWREMTRRSDVAVAQRIGANWFLSVNSESPVSFPTQVVVRWGKPGPPPHDSARAECDIVDWMDSDPRTGVMVCTYFRLDRVRVSEDEVRQFAKKWLNLKTGDELTISRTRGIVRNDGLVTCLTVEGVPIQIEAETLNFNFIEGPDSLAIQKPRIVEVSRRIDQPRPRPIIGQPGIPDEILENARGVGILWELPQPQKDSRLGTLCKVLWLRNDDEPVLGDLQIENLNELRPLGPGSLVHVEKMNNNFEIKITSPWIIARALWTVTETHSAGRTLLYIGETEYKGDNVAVAQSQPGELVIVPSGQAPIRYFSIDSGKGFVGGIDADSVFEDLVPEDSWVENYRSARFKRVVLKSRRGILVGIRRAAHLGKQLIVNEIMMRILPSRSQADLFVVRREISARRSEFMRKPHEKRPKSAEVDDGDIARSRLREYLNNPTDLDARIEERRGIRGVVLQDAWPKVPDSSVTNRWSSWVALGPNENPYFAMNEYRQDDALVRLYESEGGAIVASFRKVPAWTPETFKEKFEIEFDEEFSLRDSRLHFIGEEWANEGSSVRCNRFEWGYGRCLLVPEDQLLYEEGEFRKSQFVLFHGDVIKTIIFRRYEIQVPSSCRISIRDIDIIFSEGRRLYNQRVKHKVLHILHGRRNEGALEIQRIVGFDEHRITSERHFDKIHAHLSVTDESVLIQRQDNLQMSDDVGSPVGFTIIGRLDAHRFEQSGGKELYFEHIRLTFKTSPLGKPVRPGELTYFVAGTVVQRENDLFLQIKPITGIHPSDIGDDFRDAFVIRRREFSSQEHLLAKILETKGGSHFVKHAPILMAVIDQLPDSRPLFTMLKVPSRTVQTLRGEVNNRNGSLYAVVAKLTSDSIRIELQPGVFFTLENALVRFASPTIAEGAVVRVEQNGSLGFKITLAVFAETRYLDSKYPRPAIAFPKNPLRHTTTRTSALVKSDAFWQHKKLFTIAGFPNLQPIPGNFQGREMSWSPLISADFVKLMRTRHPKLVCVGLNEEGKVLMSPLSGNWNVGYLKWDNGTFSVRYESIDTTVNPVSLCWRHLSYADCSAKEIRTRVSNEVWNYHDKVTGSWLESGETVTSELKADSLETCPAFFERIGTALFLRYSAQNFLHFGYPVAELIRSLRSTMNHTQSYPVAGISDDQGIWVELSPGRIAELPAELLVLPTSASERSLSDLDWRQFAAGDVIELSLVEAGLLQVERVGLRNWIPGPRNSYGQKRTFLRIKHFDSENGAIMLGSGEFCLSVPLETNEDLGETVMLTRENDLQNSMAKSPARGDTFLLTVDPSGKITADGFLDYAVEPLPRRTGEWDDDPLASSLASKLRDGAGWDSPRAADLIRAAGGSLPVTADSVDLQKKIIYFTRRVQIPFAHIRSGRLLPARILGLIHDSPLAVLRFGAGVRTLQINEIVSGVPPPLVIPVIESLRAHKTLIWLRSYDDQLRSGIGDEADSEFYVTVIDIIESADGSALESGILCQAVSSLRLYWLPLAQAAWIVLTTDQARKVFKEHGREPFKVKLLAKQHCVSRIETSEAKKEFAEMLVGKETVVRILFRLDSGIGNSARFVVESLSSKTSLECEIRAYDRPSPNESLPVEVTKRILGAFNCLTVVPVGTRQFTLDVPSWMLDKDAKSKKDNRFRRLLASRHAEQVFDSSESPNLTVLPDEALDTLVCSTYFQGVNPSHPSLPYRIAVANEWLERYRRDRPAEVSVPCAIAEILLLCRNAEEAAAEHLTTSLLQVDKDLKLSAAWKTAARELFQDIGQRAQRSFHVEVLSHHWLWNEEVVHRSYDLWKRLNNLGSKLAPEFDAEFLQMVTQFVHAVRLRHNQEIMPIAKALSASTGDLSSFEGCLESTELTNRIVQLYRTIPLTRSKVSPSLDISHVRSLSEILEKIWAQAIDLTFLDVLSVSPWTIGQSA